MVTDQRLEEDAPGGAEKRRRVRPVVALTLLEAIRSQDLPAEVLEDENLSITLPRKFGLSGVIDAQMRRYREEARRRRRVPDSEVADLLRLVARRPDSDDVFLDVGARLAGVRRDGPGWRRLMPRRLSSWRASRYLSRRLRALFGRGFGRTTARPTAVEVRDDLLIRGDPGGEACHLVTGLMSTIQERYAGRGHLVVHEQCRVRGAPMCRWVVVGPDSGGVDAAGDGASAPDGARADGT